MISLKTAHFRFLAITTAYCSLLCKSVTAPYLYSTRLYGRVLADILTHITEHKRTLMTPHFATERLTNVPKLAPLSQTPPLVSSFAHSVTVVINQFQSIMASLLSDVHT